ncbi:MULTISPECIES: pilus assembly protein TadG-related protein [unclassified Luteococcus]|uniref:pilus assembly protein TadG-related protein n=1 Tax=unclassified Luteococcus TaxID=2639923 RepID=UPI00313E9F0B
MSVSVLTTAVMMAIFLVAGLVVDGTAQVRAHRRAEVVAARAARSGTDASASHRLVGSDGTQEALAAARQVLASEGVVGEVSASEGRVAVTTSTSAETTFLSLLGISTLSATGSASGELVRVKDR